MDVKMPVYHYTTIKNFTGILSRGLLSREALMNNFEDIAIEVCDVKRARKNLLNHVPFFVGSHKWIQPYDFNGFLMRNEYLWKFSNPSFYGSLNSVLRMNRPDSEYQKIIILMLKERSVRTFGKMGRVRLFDDIAIKYSADEIDVPTEATLFKEIENQISVNDNEQYSCTCELDVEYDPSQPLSFPKDFECILVDNDKIRKEIHKILDGMDIPLFISGLPRDS